MMDPTDASFAATLVVDGIHTPPPPSSPRGLVSLIPSTQAIDAISSTRKSSKGRGKAAAAAAAGDMDETSVHDEQDEGDDEEPYEQNTREQAAQETEDLTLDDDSAAHAASRRPSSTAAGKGKGKAAAAAAGKRKAPLRVGKWSTDDSVKLCSSVLAFVVAHDGMLPGACRTGKNDKPSASWVEIAKAVPHVSAVEANAGARACSSHWASLRAGAGVRHTRTRAH